MSPSKWFDYLDGRLPAHERAELEQRLANDEHCRRELEAARKIHSHMQGRPEIVGEIEENPARVERGAVLGRRLLAAFGVLVMLNVVVGIAFIVGSHKKRSEAVREAEIRQQLRSALEHTAGKSMPMPELPSDDLTISTPVAERDGVADNVIAAAEECGGSANKALPDAEHFVVLAEVPVEREPEFRQKLVALGAEVRPDETSASPVPGTKKLLQIRLLERAH